MEVPEHVWSDITAKDDVLPACLLSLPIEDMRTGEAPDLKSQVVGFYSVHG